MISMIEWITSVSCKMFYLWYVSIDFLLHVFQGEKPTQAPASNGPVNSAEVDTLTEEVSKQVSVG